MGDETRDGQSAEVRFPLLEDALANIQESIKFHDLISDRTDSWEAGDANGFYTVYRRIVVYATVTEHLNFFVSIMRRDEEEIDENILPREVVQDIARHYSGIPGFL